MRRLNDHKQIIALLLMLLILLLAALARFHHLGTQSFWYDEGVAYGHSQRTLTELIPALQNNVHVPAYFGLLAVYEDFVGSSEFALRSLSVLFSVLSVALSFALGKRLYGLEAGIPAAAFVALNTFSIYYAQETRMYAMLAAVAAASMWVFVRYVTLVTAQPCVIHLARNRTLTYGIALASLNIIGMYTHYSYALVMLAQGVMMVLWLLALLRRPAGLRRMLPVLVDYTVFNLLSLLVFAPWLGTALSQVGAQPNISQIISPEAMLRIFQGWFGFGITFEDISGNMGIVIYLLLLFGLLTLPQSAPGTWWRLLLPVVWVLLATGIYAYLELYTRYLRFLLPVQVAFALWMGRGVWVLWQIQTRERRAPLVYLPKFAAVFVTLAFMAALARGLPPLYDDPAYQRDDYRQMAQIIQQTGQPDDAIILSAPGLVEIFGYYYEGDLPVYPQPVGEDPRADLESIIQAHDRIFALFYGNAEQDPQGIVEGTLNQSAYPISDEWVGDVRFLRYATPADFADTDDVSVRLGESITLTGYALSDRTLSPGDLLQLRLIWSTDSTPQTRYKVFVQLLDESGVLVAQRDSEPGGGQQLTTTWQPDTEIVDNHALVIPPDLPPGEYTLIVGLYDLDDPSLRLSVDGDNSQTYLVLATITLA